MLLNVTSGFFGHICGDVQERRGGDCVPNLCSYQPSLKSGSIPKISFYFTVVKRTCFYPTHVVQLHSMSTPAQSSTLPGTGYSLSQCVTISKKQLSSSAKQRNYGYGLQDERTQRRENHKAVLVSYGYWVTGRTVRHERS